NLYSIPWENDFSKARNYSIGLAKYDWVLYLDADEEIEVKDLDAFKASLSEKQDVFYVPLQHYESHDLSNLNNSYLSYHFRLFKKQTALTFEGKIHERLQLNNDTNYSRNNYIKINHFGYGEVDKKEKSIRNISMLLEEWSVTPDNAWLNYHIASELFQQHELNTAYKVINHALELSIASECKPPALFYKLKYEILIYSRTTLNVLEGLEKAILIYPDYVDLHFYKGIILERTKEYEKAIRAFQHCMSHHTVNCEYLNFVGMDSFLAAYHTYLCYLHLNNKEEADREYSELEKKYPLFCENMSTYDNKYI
ncbi:glycosyltransferase, partial [Anaerosporobacter sp.]|uniref:glycosyltransferase n=1 Tax=Anaerosporobacter sp. TaxID=1872529 RepID=UPI00286F5414